MNLVPLAATGPSRGPDGFHEAMMTTAYFSISNLSRSGTPRSTLAASVLAGIALALGGTATAQGTAAISPADASTFEGSHSTTYPLGRHNARVQTLHDDIGAARTIQGHAYRRDAIATTGTVTGYQADLEISLSVSPRTADGASRTFGDNLGSAATQVLPRTTVSFPDTDRPGQAPAPTFELPIAYATPFAYPGGGAVLCVDVTLHGNLRNGRNDVNFSPAIDAHEVRGDGSSRQPGFRFGTGCAANGQRTAHSARLAFQRSAVGSLELEIASRDGLPSVPGTNDPGVTVLVAGAFALNAVWPFKPACTAIPSLDTSYQLPGNNDANGDWNGSLSGFPGLPVGQQIVTQLVSGQMSRGDITFSDGVILTVPPIGPMPRATVARIASGSDRGSPTGTVSATVPVMRFF